jgi:hypothetical protein
MEIQVHIVSLSRTNLLLEEATRVTVAVHRTWRYRADGYLGRDW